MPNLKNWIEAQLKRGYKAEQIKQLLARKGYPQAAVAQVDRVRYRASSTKTASSDKIHKKFPSKPIALISIVVGIMLIVLLFGLFFSEQSSEDVIVPEQESAEQIGEEEKLEINEEEIRRLQELEDGGEVSVSEITSNDLCKDFPKIEGEFLCEDAIGLALKEYPGEVYSVDKTEILSLLEGLDPTEKFWAVGINLDKPIEKELPVGSFASRSEIFISVDTGTISVERLS